jgi:tyrosine-protein kinase Etk/Wzc
LAQELAALLREVTVAETLYGLLSQQYEHARIQEQRDTPTFSVLDWAVGGGSKSWPKRLLLGIAVSISTLGFFVLFLLAQEYLVIVKLRDPSRYQAISGLWQTLRGTHK